MHHLLDRTTDRPTERIPSPGPIGANDVDRAVRLVDRGLHFGSLVVRIGTYLVLGLIAERFEFGRHLLAGVLFGDFGGSALRALRELRWAPVATAADLGLLGLVFAYWWCRYSWPTEPEFRALFYLAAFGALSARLGLLLGERHDDA